MKSHARNKRTLLAGWLLVLAYVGTLPSLLPAAFALMARLEGSHRVELCAGGGAARVMLTHPGGAGKSHDAIHRHCVFARMLASFAESPRNDDPDHLVKFTSGANRGVERRTLAPDAPLTADAAAPEFSAVAQVGIPVRTHVREWPQGAAPRPPDGLLKLKSTLLLV